MLSWRHSGFNVYCGPTIWPNNDQGLEDLARYFIRACISAERMSCLPAKDTLDGQDRSTALPQMPEADEGSRFQNIQTTNGFAPIFAYLSRLFSKNAVNTTKRGKLPGLGAGMALPQYPAVGIEPLNGTQNIGKVVWEQAVGDLPAPRHPVGGIKQVEQVASIDASGVSTYYSLQKTRAQRPSANLDDVG